MNDNAGFSGIVQITELDDFITPSQECVKPLISNKPKGNKLSALSIEDTVSDANKPVVAVNIKPRKRNLKDDKGLFSYHPTGCITSAETVLIQQQSHKEVSTVLFSKKKFVVMTVSPQSRASLGVKYSLSLSETDARLRSYLRKTGIDVVVDSTLGRNFSLLAAQEEFVKRWKESKQSGSRKKLLPLLASACPGWICYAEKSHGSWVLPHLSAVRSPQAVMGALVKHYFAKLKGISPGDIYHVSVMPCFDKKLEASRNDFLIPGTKVREVDCVISTSELDLLITEAGFSLENAADPTDCNDCESTSSLEWTPTESHAGSGSGGYAYHVMRYAAEKLFNLTPEEISGLQCSIQKSKDLEEISLIRGDETLLRVAIANGFRNIQNVVQKMKRNRCQYDYVEIMACPSGCLNGGGQIKASSIKEQQETLIKVSELYKSGSVTRPGDNKTVQKLIEDWLGNLDSDLARHLLFTEYHEVGQDGISDIVKW